MVKSEQIEIIYHIMLKRRLYCLGKMRDNLNNDNYENYVSKLNKVENVLKMFEWMLKEQEK